MGLRGIHRSALDILLAKSLALLGSIKCSEKRKRGVKGLSLLMRGEERLRCLVKLSAPKYSLNGPSTSNVPSQSNLHHLFSSLDLRYNLLADK